ncbi:MAG: TonB-dependent receptor [Bacteroidales bacterium]|nr:TonB-dependent receptor [Bacteroidales bacterium]
MKPKFAFLITALLLCSASLHAQNTVCGVVKDKNGESLPGVVIMVQGHNGGTVTDSDGAFTATASESDVLNISCLGYKTKSIPVPSSGTITVILDEDYTTLDESVVVGYGVQKRRDIVGAIETLGGEALSDRKTASVSRSLQGQIPGVTLTFTDGKPTTNASVRIRGNATSIGSGGSALVLVDGMETDMNTVNPDDIESISVLKDASSAAVYGAKGTFGVILITTKATKDENIHISYDGSFSILGRTVVPQTVTNGLKWFQEYREAYFSRYQSYSNSINNALPSYTADWYEELQKRDADPSYEKWRVNSTGLYEYFGNYDWHDIVFRKATTANQHNVSVSGGGKKVRFLVSGRYQGQDGIYNYGKEKFEQYNIRAKIDAQVFNWLKFSNNISFMRRVNHQPRVAEGSQTIQRQMEIVGSPLIGPKNPDGTWTHAATYIGIAGFDNDSSWWQYTKNDIREKAELTGTFFDGQLTVNADFTYYLNYTDRQNCRNILTYYSGPNTTGTQPATSFLYDYNYNDRRWTTTETVTYVPKLPENHSLTLMAGFNAEDETYIKTETYRDNILFPDKVNPSFIEGENFTWKDNGSFSASLAGFFFRAHYNYGNRYLAEFSGRYDGNSKFPANQRWGFFPSGSVAWRLSEEPFMKSTKNWLDNAKIRLSVGTAGNGLISNAYAYLSTMSLSDSSIADGGQKFKYTNAPSPVPDGLTWERNTTYNLGLDLEFLNGRLNFVADIYRKNTTDMYVVGAELPAVYGNSAPKGNYADMKTNGWEISLGWRDAVKVGAHELTYGIKAMAWDSRSFITRYTSKTGTLPTIYSTAYYEGMELGEIWGYKIAGLFENMDEISNWADQSKFKYFTGGWQDGDLKIEDVDGNGVIDNGSNTINDHGDLVKIGNALPRYCYSLSFNIGWNGINLSAMLQGVGHRDWYPEGGSGYFYGMYNRAYGFCLPWQTEENRYSDINPDPNAYWPRMRGYQSQYSGGIMFHANDRFLQNAAYLRLKNVTLDYTLPSKITKKAHIEKLRFYVTGENLLTWTPLSKHAANFDPEAISLGDSEFGITTSAGSNANSAQGAGYSYPTMRTVTLGVGITF